MMMNNDQHEQLLPEPIPAQVLRVQREFDPIRMAPTTEITFRLVDGREVILPSSGEGGRHVQAGDTGLLTYRGAVLMAFEKENGETIGGVYYIPAEEEAPDE